MDEHDTNELITVAAEEKLRMITVEEDAGIPVAASVKHYYRANPTIEIAPEQKVALEFAYSRWRDAHHRIEDNDDPRRLQELKKAYFKSIDDYKQLYQSIYGS